MKAPTDTLTVAALAFWQANAELNRVRRKPGDANGQRGAKWTAIPPPSATRSQTATQVKAASLAKAFLPTSPFA